MNNRRKVDLRYWKALNDLATERLGTNEGIAARRMANQLADSLGRFSPADWRVIRDAQREYVLEAS